MHIGRHFRSQGLTVLDGKFTGTSSAPDHISYGDMLSWSQLTHRELTQFEITAIRHLDQRYFYVLRTPDGVAPQFFDGTVVEKQVATTLRAMAVRGKQQDGQGLAELKLPKPVPVAPISRMSMKHG